MKVSQAILAANQPFEALRDFTQNMPAVASKIAENTTLTESFVRAHRERVQRLSSYVQEGGSRVWLNGIFLNIWDIDETNVYSLFPLLQEESRKIQSLSTLLHGRENAVRVASRNAAESKSFPLSFDIRFPAGSPVIYLNDLENDDRYLSWPSSINEVSFCSFL